MIEHILSDLEATVLKEVIVAEEFGIMRHYPKLWKSQWGTWHEMSLGREVDLARVIAFTVHTAHLSQQWSKVRGRGWNVWVEAT